MAHEVESMMYVGERPWHGIGNKVEEVDAEGNPRRATCKEASIQADLVDWNLEKRPMFVGEDWQANDEGVMVPNKYVQSKEVFEIFRNKDQKHIATVGPAYTILHNEEITPFFDQIAGEGSAIVETAMSLKEGKLVCYLTKLPGTTVVFGDDVSESYLLCSNGHDGQHQIRINFVKIRVVCNNTFNAAVEGLPSMFNIRHTQNVAANMVKAGEVLAKHMEWSNAFQEIATELTKTQVSDEARTNYYRKVFNRVTVQEEAVQSDIAISGDALLAAAGLVKDIKWKMADRLESRHHTDPSIAQFKGYENTPWHLLNDVTHVLDFESNRRKSTDQMSGVLFNNEVMKVKTRAVKLALDLV